MICKCKWCDVEQSMPARAAEILIRVEFHHIMRDNNTWTQEELFELTKQFKWHE